MDELQHRIATIEPLAYDRTRNYLNGQVTWLSPLLTHGITNTREVADLVRQQHSISSSYRLFFELGWREFFHRTWQLVGKDIFSDMRQSQMRQDSARMPKAVIEASTGILVIDEALQLLAERGLIHNHARLWVAGITCNVARTYWLEPARWFHYQLLDGDLASNTLSWQWVAGTFSHRPYVANQENINRYSGSVQRNSWLDIPYEDFDNQKVPGELIERDTFHYTGIPEDIAPIKPLAGTVALRSLWQLDPRWRTDLHSHIVFVDSELHERWPMNAHRWAFIRHWADRCNATLVQGTVADLTEACREAHVIRQEYPACSGWPGTVDERPWLYPMPARPFSSFSQYFKQVKGSVGL